MCFYSLLLKLIIKLYSSFSSSFSLVKLCRLSVNKCLYIENDRSQSTEVIEANLKELKTIGS